MILGILIPSIFLFLVNMIILVFSGLTFSSFLSHQLVTMFSAVWRRSHNTFINLPRRRVSKSSENSSVWKFLTFSSVMSSLTTRHHSKGGSTPPCGHPLDVVTEIYDEPKNA